MAAKGDIVEIIVRVNGKDVFRRYAGMSDFVGNSRNAIYFIDDNAQRIVHNTSLGYIDLAKKLLNRATT